MSVEWGGAEQPEAAFVPLIEMLRDELEAEGIEVPPGSDAVSSEQFSRWYLETVQLLEANLADLGGRLPMARKEVELMCRCALSAATLGQAIELIQAFARMIPPRGGVMDLIHRDGKARFTLDSQRPEQTAASSLVDIAGLFAFKQLFQWLTGGRAQVTRVGIGAMQRHEVLPFLRLFNTPVLAEGSLLYLEYESGVMDAPVVVTSGDFDRFFQLFPCGIFDALHNPLVEQVAMLISAAINQALPLPKQTEIAQALGYPLSTFRRQLRNQGVSYREIRDQTLHTIAKEMLAQERITIAQIALRLGFRDGHTFRKAFYRWEGVSPTAWRSEQRSH